jgi:hypothetical protein
MKKPYYNSQERLEIREIDCTITALRKLNLAVLHLLREFERTFKILFKL